MEVKVINASMYSLPEYQHQGDAGMDIRWNVPVTEYAILKPLERVAFSTGLSIELPEGYEAQIRPRSGLAMKKGITVLNTPGTIDCNYRGELKVLLVNLSNQEVIIKGGERIAQIVLAKVGHVDWKPVSELGDTSRGEGGFGSTGLK